MTTHPNCKINIGLQIVGKRADGYHELRTIFMPVHSMHDTLTIDPLPCGGDLLMTQQGIALDNAAADNLCAAAWRLMHREYGVPPVAITLHKAIPFGAGLGGGSSDAAFTLKMLNSIFSLGLDDSTLARHAAKIGADCPFFILNRPAYATGIGDELEPIDLSLDRFRVEVSIPEGEHVSTREAYAGVDGIAVSDRPDLRKAVRLPVESWRGLVENEFERTVLPAHPSIAALKQSFYDRGALYSSMTGSGAAVFAIFPSF